MHSRSWAAVLFRQGWQTQEVWSVDLQRRRLLPERQTRRTPCVPFWLQSPPCRSMLHPTCVCQQCQKRSDSCPALAQYCMYGTQTALAYHYAMHSTRWAQLHPQQLNGQSYMHSNQMDRATCTATRRREQYCTAPERQSHTHSN